MTVSNSWRKARGRVAASLLAAALMALLTSAPAQAQGPGHPGGQYPDPLRMGMWDHNEMGIFTPVAEDQVGTNRYFGLRQTNTWADSLLRDAEGGYYLGIHQMQRPTDGSDWVGGSQGLTGLPTGGLGPDSCHRPWTGPGTEEIVGDDVRRTVHDSTGATHTYSFGPENFRWTSTDANYMDLTGTLVSPGIQWILPWREPDGTTDQMYYLAQYYRVDGTYCGKEVTGYVYIEHVWSENGYGNTWWVRNRVGHWIFFANQYSNGDEEYGQFMCGEYGARGAVIATNDGEEELNTIDINAKLQDDGNIKYTMGDGRKFQFVQEFGFSIGGTGLGTGRVRHLGDKRKVVRSDSVHLIAQRMCRDEDLNPPKK